MDSKVRPSMCESTGGIVREENYGKGRCEDDPNFLSATPVERPPRQYVMHHSSDHAPARRPDTIVMRRPSNAKLSRSRPCCLLEVPSSPTSPGQFLRDSLNNTPGTLQILLNKLKELKADLDAGWEDGNHGASDGDTVNEKDENAEEKERSMNMFVEYLRDILLSAFVSSPSEPSFAPLASQEKTENLNQNNECGNVVDENVVPVDRIRPQVEAAPADEASVVYGGDKDRRAQTMSPTVALTASCGNRASSGSESDSSSSECEKYYTCRCPPSCRHQLTGSHGGAADVAGLTHNLLPVGVTVDDHGTTETHSKPSHICYPPTEVFITASCGPLVSHRNKAHEEVLYADSSLKDVTPFLPCDSPETRQSLDESRRQRDHEENQVTESDSCVSGVNGVSSRIPNGYDAVTSPGDIPVVKITECPNLERSDSYHTNQPQTDPSVFVQPQEHAHHRRHHDRPKSFLRDEMDEFNKIFTELLFSNRDHLSSNLTKEDEEEEEDDSLRTMGNGDTASVHAEKGSVHESSSTYHEHSQQHACVTSSSSDVTSDKSMAYKRASCPNPSAQRASRDSGLSESPLPGRRPAMLEENDKLFRQLLDDLDNITTSNSSSIRRRRRARDLFSDWLFSDDARRSEQVPLRRKTNSAFKDFAAKRRSADITNIDARRQEMLQRWRPHSCDCHSEDDADSGYHTGHNTLKANTKGQQAGSAPPLEPLRIPSQDTLTREDLRRCIETFNGNQHGLIMTMHCEETSYQGFIRVHMNLIRPINMSISTRPPSIYDVMSHSEDEEEEDPGQEEVTSFYLPKDTSKVIHIECSTTTQEVIKALLTKYKITDNPRKFALYEKLIQDKKERMRRMADDEHPLQLCLEWSKPGLEGLDVHKFVLQENDTGEILWEAFSIPELENFLGILNKEEEDYAEQVKHKYRLLKIQMDRRLKEIRPKASSPPADDKRSPIFV